MTGHSIDPSHLTTQRWEQYAPAEHAVWAALSRRRLPELRARASAAWLEGFEAIGLDGETIPDLRLMNERLAARTGWAATPVTGFLPSFDFFGFLARRRFPTAVTIRPAERLDYVPEPDIFHDVFGHVPLHAHPTFADLLQRLGRIGLRARDDAARVRVTRFFWFTVEFGLVAERGETKLYGSGLISSIGDGAHALSPGCERLPFRLEEVLETPFQHDRLQDRLFVIDSFRELEEATAALSLIIGH